jgi:uncharacterized protein
MKIFAFLLITIFLFISCSKTKKTDYPILPISSKQVKLEDSFWKERIRVNNEVTIPYCFQKCEETHRIANFEVAGGLIKGTFEGIRYNDSDVYKIIEGAAYSLQQKYDPKLDAYLDSLIFKIAAAQEDDGYLYTIRTIKGDSVSEREGKERWVAERQHSHELYNVGHLYEAAVAHYYATGKTTLLDVALKNAELINSVFGPDKRHDASGHQEIEIGLAKLYRVTGEEKYLTLAKFFLDERGKSNIRNYKSTSMWENGAYWQDHKPVVDQEEAVGHAVRAGYMYSAMADVAALTGDPKYLEAIKKIWENVVGKKYYITGGIGALYDGEAFGENFELPNRAYNETCAAIANVFWNHRMFLMTGESKYIDVLERSLYNGVLPGISFEGNTFFYPNVLEFDGKDPFNQGATERKPWFDCSCCPSNLSRFIPAVPAYFYAMRGNEIFANLYAASEVQMTIGKSIVKIRQVTNYPWEGKIRFEIQVDKPADFKLNLRIPGWAKNQPVPSDLYSYASDLKEQVTLIVNDNPYPLTIQNGYALISKKWKLGDVIELNLPLEVKEVIANNQVKNLAGKTAIERGPLVYCAEQVDNPGGVLHRTIGKNESFTTENTTELKGITKIKSESGLTLIPYYAWSHRGLGEMEVWFDGK